MTCRDREPVAGSPAEPGDPVGGQSAAAWPGRALRAAAGRAGPRVAARPTEAGRSLYKERRSAGPAAAVEGRLRTGRGGDGPVRVATVYSVGLHTLPAAMKRSLAAYPRSTSGWSTAGPTGLQACAGRRDRLRHRGPARARPQLEVIPLRGDELVLALAPGDPLARGRRPWRRSTGQPFIAFERDIPTRRLIDRLLRRQRVTVTGDGAGQHRDHQALGRGRAGSVAAPRPALANEVRARTLVATRPARGPAPPLHRRAPPPPPRADPAPAGPSWICCARSCHRRIEGGGPHPYPLPQAGEGNRAAKGPALQSDERRAVDCGGGSTARWRDPLNVCPLPPAGEGKGEGHGQSGMTWPLLSLATSLPQRVR